MRRLLLLLLCCCLLLSGCSRTPLAARPDASIPANLPAPVVPDLPENQDQATLWFRFGPEPLLAAESREITHSRTESHAMAILRALLEGPATAGLTALFPQGTQVISVTQADRVMFVTLSRHILNSFPDEPANWRDQALWADEVPLRRTLAMQSIAATLTENCGVDTVVVLLEQTDAATDSLRLRQGYYTLDGDVALASPLTRDESLLLTPIRTAEVILQCWQEEDWARLYRYLAAADPDTGVSRPREEDFSLTMSSARQLLHAEVSGGSVTMDGQSAVFTVSGAWLAQGQEQPFTGMILRLTREKGLWHIGLSQLTGREALP